MTPDIHQNSGRILKVDIIEPSLVLTCLFCIDLAIMVQNYVGSILYMLRVMYNSIFSKLRFLKDFDDIFIEWIIFLD